MGYLSWSLPAEDNNEENDEDIIVTFFKARQHIYETLNQLIY